MRNHTPATGLLLSSLPGTQLGSQPSLPNSYLPNLLRTEDPSTGLHVKFSPMIEEFAPCESSQLLKEDLIFIAGSRGYDFWDGDLDSHKKTVPEIPPKIC